MISFIFDDHTINTYMEGNCHLLSFVLNSFTFNDSEIHNIFMYDLFPNGKEYKVIVHSLLYIISTKQYVDINGIFMNKEEVINFWEDYYNVNDFTYGKFEIIPNHSSHNRYLETDEINSCSNEEINETKIIAVSIMENIYL